MNIRVSIVVYKPDVELLKDVVDCLAIAASVLRQNRHGSVAYLDIMNNNPGDDAFERLNSLLEKSILNDGFDISFIDSPGNIGYGAANNISIKRSDDSVYHLVLNPDALLEPRTLIEAVDFMEANPNIGLLVPKVLGFDGEIHHLCKLNPSLFDMYLRGFAPQAIKNIFSIRMSRFLMLDRDYEKIINPVPYPSGCFMFFRADILRKINGFDERFFMYLEDADIGRRILQLADVAYVPSVAIRHKWTRGTHNDWRLRWATVVSALKYWRKWGGMFVGTS